MDDKSLEFLEFHSVLEIVAEAAVTAQGRAEILRLRPRPDLPSICRMQDELKEAFRLDSSGKRIRFDLPEGIPLLETLADSGAVLDPEALLDLLAYLRFAEVLRHALSSSDFPALHRLCSEAAVPASLLGRIENALDDKGRIRDSAHPDLGTVRSKQEQSRKRIQNHLRGFLQGSRTRFLIDEPFVTQRANRYVLPVRVESQREVPGIVHGTSSSGATVFVEPFSAVDLNNDHIFFQEREIEIVRQVLRSLTEEARAGRDQVEAIYRISGELEARVACASFWERYGCSIPDVIASGRLELRGARHPLLLNSLGSSAVVPIELELGGEAHVLVISGPNTGGKTAALKTVGLLSLMAHCGLPVPASAARIPLLCGIHADIGDHQSITQQQSTFSSHIERIRELTGIGSGPSLILLDELGRGTDPAYGTALAIAVLEHFRRLQHLVFATTHHRAVKSYAALTEGVINASVRLDSSTMRPTYQLAYGVAGGSSGLEIAAQLGLPPEVVDYARTLLDDKDSLAEGYLGELRARIGQLQMKEQEYTDRLRLLEQDRVELRRQAEAQRQEQEKQFERALENLMNDFRREGHSFIKRMADRSEAQEAQKRLQLREAALKDWFRRKARRPQKESVEPDSAEQSTGLRPGDLVYHRFFRSKGRIVSVDGDSALVDIGGKNVSAQGADLQRIELTETVQQPSPQITVRVVEDTDPELNLIGKTVEEASFELDKYLDRAFVSRLPEVRIVHGFGTGRLRAFVEAFLAKHCHVLSFEVEGGSTRVKLKV
jgi:DNA mismatch repair protein MutS2